MTIISADDARNHFSDIVNRAAYAKERTIVTRHGKKVAAVVSIEDLDLLEAVIERLEYQRDLSEAHKALKEVESEGTVSWEQIKKDLDL